MIRLYRITALVITLIFLTTYSPHEFNIFINKKNIFFKLENIEIQNNNLINESKILEKLTQIYGKSVIFIKRDEIEKPLNSIDFLERIEVKKKYPSTILVKVYETKPIAILFKKNQKYLIDSSSNLILFDEKLFFDNLPNVFGKGADKNFIDFFTKLENNDFSINRIKNFYYFQIGRWDLELLNNKIIKFPSSDTSKAIQQSVELLSRDDFENYNIIDLRIHGKIIVK